MVIIMRMISLAIISIVILLLVSGCVDNQTGNNATTAPNTPKTVKTPVVKTAANNTSNISDTVPPGTISYIHASMDTKSINWSWTNPPDADFNYNNIYIDGKFRKNQSQNYYNLTGVAAGKTHNISVRTVDKNKNINPEWINSTTATKSILKDTIPPGQVDRLRADVNKTTINWTWENPDDNDYGSAMIYIDGKSKGTVNAPKNYYLLTGLSQNTRRTISIRTVDKLKNINLLWSNDTEITTADNTPPHTITGLKATFGLTWIDWTWTNPRDDDFSYVNIYINGVSKKPKFTLDSYNATGLKANTSYTVSIVTSDTSNNINTNWVNDTESTLDNTN